MDAYNLSSTQMLTLLNLCPSLVIIVNVHWQLVKCCVQQSCWGEFAIWQIASGGTYPGQNHIPLWRCHPSSALKAARHSHHWGGSCKPGASAFICLRKFAESSANLVAKLPGPHGGASLTYFFHQPLCMQLRSRITEGVIHKMHRLLMAALRANRCKSKCCKAKTAHCDAGIHPPANTRCRCSEPLKDLVSKSENEACEIKEQRRFLKHMLEAYLLQNIPVSICG